MLKRTLIAISAILLSVSFAFAQTTAQPEIPKSDKETIAGLEKEYLKALVDGNINLLERLLSDSYISPPNATKKVVLDDLKNKGVAYLTYETTGVEIEISNGVATVAGSMKSERRVLNNDPRLVEGTFKRTWKLEGKDWKVSSYVSQLDRLERRASAKEMEEAAKKLKPKKSLVFSYDRFNDFSVIETDPYNLVGGGESFMADLAVGLARQNGDYSQKNIVTDVYFRAGIGFLGTTLVGKPYQYLLAFDTTATNWQFIGEDKTLYFIIDEQRLKLEPSGRDNEVGGNSSLGVRTHENLRYWISTKDLERIANAKSVELRLGNTKPRKFKEELLGRIRNLLFVTANEPIQKP